MKLNIDNSYILQDMNNLRYLKCVGGDIVKTASQGCQSEPNQVLKLLSCVSPSESRHSSKGNGRQYHAPFAGKTRAYADACACACNVL